MASNHAYYQHTREVVPRILDLFSKYQIKATWATVGMLMCENQEEWNAYQPEELPTFKNQKFSAYHWLHTQKDLYEKDLFAPDLVNQVIHTPGQELGSHSFAHYYSMEEGQTISQWKADLRAAKKIARDKFGKNIESLVFPRNQYSEEVIQAAQQEGFYIFRTNPEDWFWKEVEKESLPKKVFRTGDTLFPLGLKTSYTPFEKEGDILRLPASRILRPYRKGSLFNGLRIARIKGEIDTAIRNKEIYHLWWHPHNFGNYPVENLKILEEFLIWIKSKVDLGDLVSESMESMNQKISAAITS
ncbi:MAG: polysaccharide deacetylase family protein [Flavobacteriaceae bacterium]|nr:polysaccharide deacetylase family protein [Flavobacteriaceae bacterium]